MAEGAEDGTVQRERLRAGPWLAHYRALPARRGKSIANRVLPLGRHPATQREIFAKARPDGYLRAFLCSPKPHRCGERS